MQRQAIAADLLLKLIGEHSHAATKHAYEAITPSVSLASAKPTKRKMAAFRWRQPNRGEAAYLSWRLIIRAIKYGARLQQAQSDRK